MRLLIVSQYFWPENFRINDLVAALIERGHEVTVLTGLPNYPDGKVFPEFAANPENFMNFRGAKVLRASMITRGKAGLRLIANYASFALSASRVARRELRGRSFDAIFVYAPSPITSAIPAVRARAVTGAPIALWVLDLWPDTLSSIGVVRSAILLRAVGVLVAWIYRHCDLILAQSKSFITQIERYCDPQLPTRIEYFPSWAEAAFEHSVVSLADELPPKDDRFDIMFAGNIGDAQDFAAILACAEVLKSDPRIRWLIIGDGRSAPWVAQEIARRELSASVKMLGRYPIDRMPAFYARADALLVTLKNEPIFGMTIPGKLQTYLAAGRPVLGMLNGEGARAIEEAGCGFSSPAGDSHALAAAIGKLVAMSDAEREQFGERGKLYAKREFDRAKLIDRLELWLGSLIRARKSAGSATHRQ